MATQQATHTISNNTDTVTLGAIFVALGAASYGMLSTFVKLAYKQNFTTAEVTVSQFAWGALILTLLNIIFNKNKPKASKQDIIKLMITGTPLGLTSMLYYLCVKYIDASIAVVLLMQSVWIGVFIEAFINKKMPSLIKVIAVILIFFGTLLATNVISSSHAFLDIRGLILGFLTAISFSCSLLSTSKVASHLAPIERSRYMLYGSSILVLIFGFVTQIAPYYFDIHLVSSEFTQSQPFNFTIFLTYGLIVAVFGTVIPPIMLNKGFPLTGVGLGSIMSSVELPFAVFIAFMLLSETVQPIQWLGVLVILFSIFLMNYKMIKLPPVKKSN